MTTEQQPFIGCAVCLNIKAHRTPATNIIKGYSVCDEHVDLADRPGFNIFNLKGKPR